MIASRRKWKEEDVNSSDTACLRKTLRHPVGALPEIAIGTGNEPAGYILRVWPQFSEENTTFFSFVVQYLTTD